MPRRVPARTKSPELESIGRIRTAATWLRRSSQPIERYPRLSQLTAAERDAAIKFAKGDYPWPSRWTVKLYHMAIGN